MIYYGLLLAPYYFNLFGCSPLKNIKNSNPLLSPFPHLSYNMDKSNQETDRKSQKLGIINYLIGNQILINLF
jgi:hypothetical protein